MSNELATAEKNGNALTPLEMLDRAVASGASVETLEQLMTLNERHQANLARQAFIQARAAAKAQLAEAPIYKNRTGHNNKRYADFSAYAKIIDPILAEHGLSYGFETEHADTGGVKVTCVLSHEAGHEVRNSLAGPPDQTGNKNAIQAIGSTVTYLQRYTLTAALGLSAADDDDGRAAGGVETISDEQVAELRQLIIDTDTDLPRLIARLGVEKLEDIYANQYDGVVTLIKQVAEKRKAKAEKAKEPA